MVYAITGEWVFWKHIFDIYTGDSLLFLDWDTWSQWSGCSENNGRCWKSRIRHCSTGNDFHCTGQSADVQLCGQNDCYHGDKCLILYTWLLCVMLLQRCSARKKYNNIITLLVNGNGKWKLVFRQNSKDIDCCIRNLRSHRHEIVFTVEVFMNARSI